MHPVHQKLNTGAWGRFASAVRRFHYGRGARGPAGCME